MDGFITSCCLSFDVNDAEGELGICRRLVMPVRLPVYRVRLDHIHIPHLYFANDGTRPVDPD